MARPSLSDQKRTQRATLLMTPDDYEGLSILAQLQNRTVNDFACSILIQVVQRNRQVIENFKAEKEKYAATINVSVVNEDSPSESD